MDNALISIVRAGRFADADALLRRIGRSTDPQLTLLQAEVSERLGRSQEATRICSRVLALPGIDPSLAARCGIVLGAIALEDGQVDAAIRHFQDAADLASRNKCLEQQCWAELRLLVAKVERSPAEAHGGLLADLRKHVAQLGDPFVSIALHVFVSEVEAKRGSISTAVRHARVAHTLLRDFDNAWLEGLTAISEFCIAYLSSDLSTAHQLARATLNSVSKTGHARTRLAAHINLGHTYLQMGELAKAERWLQSAWKLCDIAPRCKDPVLEGFAQLELARRNPAACDEHLRRLAASDAPDLAYPKLWSVPTAARSFAMQSRWADALAKVEDGLRLALSAKDVVLERRLLLLRAEARAHTGDLAGAADDLTATALGDEPPPLDIMAEAQRVAGAVLEIEGDLPGGRAACERSARIFMALGHLRAAEEVRGAAAGAGAGIAIDDEPSLGGAITASTPPIQLADGRTDLLLRRAAAALAQAARPDLLGPELLAVAIESGTATAAAVVTEDGDRGAAVIETAGWSEQEALSAAVTPDPPAIALGTWRGMEWRLVARVPSTVAARTAWTSIHTLAASGVALATARREAREREALWPIDDPDDPAPGIFASEQMLELLRIARRVAQTGVTVLLTGETGVGKEVFARVIHDASRRAGKPFRTVNCSAVPRDMLENHLFGHRRGAYTGADEAASGALRAAAGGTVFLDEIGDVGYHIQPKLLRFLESGEIQPLGEPHTMQVDVRIVAATNKDLDRLVSDGQFRDDLYYRLNIVRLHIPPLRERREEIPSLVQHFLERFSREFHKTRLRLADETMEYLLLHPWPGNVRQLQNELRRMAALAEPGAVLMPEHLSRWVVAGRLTKPVSERERELQPTEVVVRLDQPLAAATEHVERAMIQHAMAICDGRVEQVARMLGLSRKGLYLKRQRLGIEQPH